MPFREGFRTFVPARTLEGPAAREVGVARFDRFFEGVFVRPKSVVHKMKCRTYSSNTRFIRVSDVIAQKMYNASHSLFIAYF